jgi:uncharacterized membrane protein YccC
MDFRRYLRDNQTLSDALKHAIGKKIKRMPRRHTVIFLSTRAKEAIKTGLAMVIVFAIAFPLGWENPMWAGVAVMVLSLPTIGMSLNKTIRRIAGTLLAVCFGLLYLGLFPQDRWWLLGLYSLHLGVCAYMLTGKKNPYFWHVLGFVTLTILTHTSGTSEGAFEAAMARLEQNGLGILAYSLVAMFLWPRSSMGALKDVSSKLFATQGRLYRIYRERMAGRDSPEEVQLLRMQEAALLPKVGPTLEAAEADSHEVFALRHQWRHFHHLSKNLGEALERWRQSLPEIQPLDLTALLPNLENFYSELDLRFEKANRLLDGETPVQSPQPITLAIDKVKVQALSNFQRAAVAVTKTELERLEVLTRSLLDCVLDIRGCGRPTSISLREEAPHGGLAINPDRLMAAIRMMTLVWIAFLIWVYVDNLPGGIIFVYMTVILGQAALMAGISAWTMLMPFALGTLCWGLLYVFVMPHLSGFVELGLLIFSWTFAVFYLWPEPRQGLARLGALLPFLAFTNLQNQQTYSFADYASNAAMIMLVISLIIATEYLFQSPRPEKVFLRLLGRFFRHSEFLMSHLASDWGGKQGLAGLWKTAYYHNDLLELPEKLAKWEKQIDYRTFPNNTPEQVQALVTSLQALAYRIKALVDAREHQQAGPLLRLVHDDLRAWRIRVENRFRRWSENPTDMPEGDLQERLTRKLASMEERIKKNAVLATQEDLNEEDYKNFYRLLGSFRSLTESVVGHARLAEQFDFAHWREARF